MVKVVKSIWFFLSTTVLWDPTRGDDDRPEVKAESLTCIADYNTKSGILIGGQKTFVDSDDWWVTSFSEALKTNREGGEETLYLIQTPLEDATSTEQALAVFQSVRHMQYFICIPKTDNGAYTWMTKSGWTLFPDGSIILVNQIGDGPITNVDYAVYQKKFLPNIAMTIGPNEGSDVNMMFILYHGLENLNDGGVTPYEAPETAATCSAHGDPHYVDFQGNKLDDFEIEQTSDTWLHLIRAKDCAFDIQVNAESHGQVIDKTMIRIGKDLIRVDHNDENGVTLKSDLSSPESVTTIKIFTETDGRLKYKIRNLKFGLTIFVKYVEWTHATVNVNRNFYANIDLFLSNGYYQENVNGVCGVVASNPFSNAMINPESCGGTPKSDKYNYSPMAPSQVLWDKFDTWETIQETPEADWCLRHYCVDPSLNVGDFELPLPQVSKCAPALDLNADKEIEFASAVRHSRDCNALDDACRNVHENIFIAGRAACLELLIQNPWESDCNCMIDWCQIGSIKQPSDVTDGPCQQSPVNTDNIVPKSQFDYATLDFAHPNDPGSECHSDRFRNADGEQKFAQIPFGWEMVPSDDTNVDALLNDHSFGTKCIMTERIAPYAIGGFSECGNHEIIEREHDDFYKCIAVKVCPSRVLIRRLAATPISQYKPSLIGWEINGDSNVVVGNRGFQQKNLTDWVIESMTIDTTPYGKIGYDLANENIFVINFVRDATEHEFYACAMGGNKVDSTTSYLKTEWITKPSYPLYWKVQDQATDDDRFNPLLYGPHLKTENFYNQGENPHAMCVGPLNTDGHFCVDFKITKHSGFTSVHVVGPSKEDPNVPIKSFYNTDLTENEELVITFCPTLVTERFMTTCAAT